MSLSKTRALFALTIVLAPLALAGCGSSTPTAEEATKKAAAADNYPTGPATKPK